MGSLMRFYKKTKSMDIEGQAKKKYPHGPILAFTSMVVNVYCANFFPFSQKWELIKNR